MRIRPLLLVALIVMSWMVTVRPAAACTCAPFDARKALSESPAAFVGSLVIREPFAAPGEPALADGERVFQFRVSTEVKGDLGDVVAVRSAQNESSCGLSVAEGQEVGILLSQRDGVWYGSLCRQTTPERLLRAAQELPPPDATPPPDLVVGSTFGGGRATGLKFDGRVTGMGAGAGTTTALSACPDNDHVAELFTTVTPEGATLPGVAVRRVATMAVEFERMLPDWRSDPAGPPEALRAVTAVSCRSGEGRDVAVAGVIGNDASGRSQILRVARPGGPSEPAEGTLTLLWEGAPYRHAAFGPSGGVAYLGLFPNGEDLVAVELPATGPAGPTPRPIISLPPGAGAVTVSPDGSRLATVAVSMSQPTRVALVEVSTSPPSLRVLPLSGDAGVQGEMLWAGDDRVVFAPRLRPVERVRVFDTDLRELRSWSGWSAERSVATPAGLLYGAGRDVSGETVISQAPLDTGNPRAIRQLEDALVFALVDVSAASATKAGGTPTTGRAEGSTTSTSAPSPTAPPRSPQKPPVAVTTTTAPAATPVTPTSVVNPTPAVPGSTTTSTTIRPATGPGPGPGSGEALPRPGPVETDGRGGGGGGLSGWVLAAMLVVGVGAAVGTAAALSRGGLTATRKRA